MADRSSCLALLLPETRGRSLEEMDVLFGSVTQEERDAEIARKATEKHVGEKLAVEHDERKTQV